MDKKHRIFKEIGKIAVSFSNLIFASLVLGTIIRGGYAQWTMLVVGGSLVLILAVLGVFLLTRGEEVWN